MGLSQVHQDHISRTHLSFFSAVLHLQAALLHQNHLAGADLCGFTGKLIGTVTVIDACPLNIKQILPGKGIRLMKKAERIVQHTLIYEHFCIPS
jgi:hypothetical protein